MYSVVLMVAATSGGDMASFGHKDSAGCSGCTGVVVSTSCHGSSCHGSGFLGMKSGGLFSHKNSCHGSCTGCTGCTGYVVPSGCTGCTGYVVPSGCTGCTGYYYGCTGCTGCTGCHGSSCHGGFLGMKSGGGLFKHKGGCTGSCYGGCYGG